MTDTLKDNHPTKVRWVDELTPQYLAYLHEHEPNPYWTPGMTGVYIGSRYVNDFYTHVWWGNYKRMVTDPTNLAVIGVVSVLTSKSFTPKDLTSEFIKDSLILFVMFTIFCALPWLIVGLIIDLFYLLPYSIYTVLQTEQYFIQLAKDQGIAFEDLVDERYAELRDAQDTIKGHFG
jgi:hypothetical protein